jgi:hypothetical protein
LKKLVVDVKWHGCEMYLSPASAAALDNVVRAIDLRNMRSSISGKSQLTLAIEMKRCRIDYVPAVFDMPKTVAVCCKIAPAHIRET